MKYVMPQRLCHDRHGDSGGSLAILCNIVKFGDSARRPSSCFRTFCCQFPRGRCEAIIYCAQATAPGTDLNELADLVIDRLIDLSASMIGADDVIEQAKIVKKKRSSRLAKDRSKDARRQIWAARLHELNEALDQDRTRDARTVLWREQRKERTKLESNLAKSREAAPNTELAVRTANAVDVMLSNKAVDDATTSEDEQDDSDDANENDSSHNHQDDIDASASNHMMPLGQRELAHYRRVAGRVAGEI